MANTTDLSEQQPLYSLQSHEIAPNRVDSNNKGNREKKNQEQQMDLERKSTYPLDPSPGIIGVVEGWVRKEIVLEAQVDVEERLLDIPPIHGHRHQTAQGRTQRETERKSRKR